MLKTEFLEKLHEEGGFETKKATTEALEAVLGTIKKALVEGEDLSFIGFGSFKVVDRAARVCRNPKTGEEVKVPAKKAIKFKVAKAIVDELNK